MVNTVRRRVIGTPSAVVVDVPKLDRMSLRMIPLSVSTFGPLVPSPGYGPLVSSGISVSVPPAAARAVVDPAAEDALDEEPAAADDEPDAAEDVEVTPQAASPSVAAPSPKAFSIRRRLTRVVTSNDRPWSTSSSSGRASGRPS